MRRIGPWFLSAISEWHCLVKNCVKKNILITWNVTHADGLFLEGYIGSEMSAHIHWYAHTQAHAHGWTHTTHAYTHTFMRMYVYAHTHTQIHTSLHTYSRIHEHTHTCIHVCTLTCAHAHTCTHTHKKKNTTHRACKSNNFLIPLCFCLLPPFWWAYSKRREHKLCMTIRRRNFVAGGKMVLSFLPCYF